MMALLTVTFGANQHVSGLGLTIVLIGLSEFANRLMEILDKHSNWSSSGKQDYCEIFEHHELDPFIDPDYCN